MRCITTLLLIVAALAALVNAAPDFRNQLHVFQTFAAELYPHNTHQQKKAVVTLKYLFQSQAWHERQYLEPLYNYLKTGGYTPSAKSLNSITLEHVHAHLTPGTLYQNPAYIRPALDTLISRHFKQAKKKFGFGDELLQEPPNLTGLGRERPAVPVGDAFRNTPQPLTEEEAAKRWNAMGGPSASNGRDGRGRMVGLPWGQ